MLKFIAPAVFALSSAVAVADETVDAPAEVTGIAKIGLHLGTVHNSKVFNDFNPGVYAVLENGVTAGTYFNSERKQTFYAGKTWSAGSFAVSAVALTGYRRAPLVPGLIPSVSLPVGERVEARASLILTPEKASRAVHFSLEFAL